MRGGVIYLKHGVTGGKQCSCRTLVHVCSRVWTERRCAGAADERCGLGLLEVWGIARRGPHAFVEICRVPVLSDGTACMPHVPVLRRYGCPILQGAHGGGGQGQDP